VTSIPTFHHIDGAPDPVAPFSHAVEADGWVFVTGQMPFAGRSIESAYPTGIAAQTDQVMRNLVTVLEGCGLRLDDVVQARVFLVHFDADYDAMNAAYSRWFAPGRLPARTCVGVTALAKGARVEIDFIARRPGPGAPPPVLFA
jgi:2-iminobutanoate/2-iminopropanoate deaminase